MSRLLDIEMLTIGGEKVTLSDLHASGFLVVNVASKCGFTDQYGALEKLYQDYKEKGLVVLGFPCNQFGKQEPGSNEDIQAFCSNHYSVTFPMFSKIDVNGENTDALYEELKNAAPGLLNSKAVKWNFTKFLVSGDGQTVKRFPPQTKPLEIPNDPLFQQLFR